MRNKIFFILLFAMLLVVTRGCTYEPRELPPYDYRLDLIIFDPAHFCPGEIINIRWEAEGIDKIRFLKQDGSLLLETTGWGASSGATPPMEPDWVPLSLEAFSPHYEDGPAVTASLKEKVTNIEDETWTSLYDSNAELRASTTVLVPDPAGPVQEYDSETGTMVDVNRYYIYQDFYGFTWQIPLTDFSPKAVLLKIKNGGDETMRFTISGVQGEWMLSPGAMTTLLGNNVHPSRTIQARYLEPQQRKIGKQKGEITKPENEHFERQDLYLERKYRISLLVICRDA